MPVQPRVYRELSPHNTSLNTRSCSDRNRLRTHLHTLGHTALAAKAERCCTHFRVLACDNGHAYRPIPPSAVGSGCVGIAPTGASSEP
jgi:hypothetical protein